MKIQWKKLIISIAVPLAVGGLSALLTKNGMQSFETISKPPLSPPAWIFPVVWTVIYVLMGAACYIVWTTQQKEQNALFYYGIQLFFNFFWSIIFFNIKNYLFAFIWLLMLLAAIIAATVKFFQTKRSAGYLMIPYIIWVTFAGYLNLGIYLLNR
ncbi:MAG: tryptophan-rich sensory protein [Oscillospiraceae bacterium]|nr:tryptophan-rich sensory protein [Oscillospiraceae bacterium]